MGFSLSSEDFEQSFELKMPFRQTALYNKPEINYKCLYNPCENKVTLNGLNVHLPPNTVKLHILEWPFIVASLRHTCAIIMLSNQHLDMSHL